MGGDTVGSGIVIGDSANNTGSSAGISIGQNSTATNGNSISIGVSAINSGQDGICIGSNTSINGQTAVVVGHGSSASTLNSIALGTVNVSSGSGAISIGNAITNSQSFTTIINDGNTTNPTAPGAVSASSEFMLSFGSGMELIGNTAVGNYRYNYASQTINNSPTWRLVQAQVMTTTNTTTTVLTVPMNSNSVMSLNGNLLGVRTGGISGSPGDSWSFNFSAKVKDIAGTLTASPLTTHGEFDGTIIKAVNLKLLLGTNTFSIQILGATTTNITWNLNLQLNEINY